MRANTRGKWGESLIAVAVASLLSGCSTVESIMPSLPSLSPKPAAANGADPNKIVVLPMSSTDLDCPVVEIEDGAAAARVGGPDNKSVRYQFNIVDTARECQPQGSQFSLKVGVSGNLLLGPAGSPGTYSTSLKVIVRREVDQKTVYEKALKVEASTTAAAEGAFQVVTEPFLLPMTRAQLNDDYSVFVGFSNGRNVAMERPRHRAKPRQ